MCLSSSTDPSVIKKMIGIEPGEWENNSIAWDKGKTETVGISQ